MFYTTALGSILLFVTLKETQKSKCTITNYYLTISRDENTVHGFLVNQAPDSDKFLPHTRLSALVHLCDTSLRAESGLPTLGNTLQHTAQICATTSLSRKTFSPPLSESVKGGQSHTHIHHTTITTALNTSVSLRVQFLGYRHKSHLLPMPSFSLQCPLHCLYPPSTQHPVGN